MLPRLRRPDSGAIEIDGTGLDQFDVAALRRGIAYVPQQPQLFDVTVAEHIRYGKPDASFDEIVAAAGLAGADEFIRALPGGYDARCGAGGQSLSGGQRQRLDLARALVRRAPILILDEPSSSLDAESEHRLRLALEQIRERHDTTMIVIAHRLSTVAMADRIAVMGRGELLAEGRHQELMAMNGWYAEAFRRQTQFESAPDRPRQARASA
jgi:ABC-type multidrug transport system fused ATPase/permease subunit